MLPVLVKERAIRRFCFYQNGRLYEGMSHQNRLYQLVENFSSQDRPGVYLLACQLTQNGEHSVITASSQRYQVWVRLHAQDAIVERRCELSHCLD
jgi:hypothetical protein